MSNGECWGTSVSKCPRRSRWQSERNDSVLWESCVERGCPFSTDMHCRRDRARARRCRTRPPDRPGGGNADHPVRHHQRGELDSRNRDDVRHDDQRRRDRSAGDRIWSGDRISDGSGGARRLQWDGAIHKRGHSDEQWQYARDRHFAIQPDIGSGGRYESAHPGGISGRPRQWYGLPKGDGASASQ